jgi:hypothetical protein
MNRGNMRISTVLCGIRFHARTITASPAAHIIVGGLEAGVLNLVVFYPNAGVPLLLLFVVVLDGRI